MLRTLWRMAQTGLFAGFVTALVYSAVQAVAVTPLIVQAETYEQAAGGHSHGVTAHVHADGQVHLHTDGAGGPAVEPTAPWQPADGFERHGATVLANIATAIGFAFVMVAAFAIYGRPVDLRAGLWWGAAGYATFVLAPSLGLPPEAPGTVAAELAARQTWWWSAAAATAVGLGLLVFARPLWLRAAGVLVVLLPHLIGAPHPPGGGAGSVPPELAAHYVVWSLVTALMFWLLLGASAGEIYRRLGAAEARAADQRAAS